MRLVATDVYYDDGSARARAAGLVFDDWEATSVVEERVVHVSPVAPYEPGRFYLRELPCLLSLLAPLAPDLVIVDGFVDLGPGRPGLGRHLHEALGLPVVGVAKTSFHGAAPALVQRGGSARPLYVTAVGLGLDQAAEGVARMAGPNRIPILLQRVDHLSRGLAEPGPNLSTAALSKP